MIDYLLLANIALTLAALLLMITELIIALMAKNTYNSPRDYFVILFSMLTLSTASTLTRIISENFLTNPIYTQILICVEFLSTSFLTVLLTGYLFRAAGKDSGKSPIMYINVFLWAVYCALLIYTQFSTTFYHVSSDNVYHRGQYFFVLFIPLVAIMAINLITLLVMHKEFTKRQFVFFAIF